MANNKWEERFQSLQIFIKENGRLPRACSKKCIKRPYSKEENTLYCWLNFQRKRLLKSQGGNADQSIRPLNENEKKSISEIMSKFS